MRIPVWRIPTIKDWCFNLSQSIDGVFNIRGDLTVFRRKPSGLSGLLSWEITDIHSSVIATGRDQSDEFTIDISNHLKGIYYLKITQGGLQTVRKLVLY